MYILKTVLKKSFELHFVIVQRKTGRVKRITKLTPVKFWRHQKGFVCFSNAMCPARFPKKNIIIRRESAKVAEWLLTSIKNFTLEPALNEGIRPAEFISQFHSRGLLLFLLKYNYLRIIYSWYAPFFKCGQEKCNSSGTDSRKVGKRFQCR